MRCNTTRTVNVIANDYDPNGYTPISVTVASGATVVSPSSIEIDTTAALGTVHISYTLTNRIGGTTLGGVTVTVTGNEATCFGNRSVNVGPGTR